MPNKLFEIKQARERLKQLKKDAWNTYLELCAEAQATLERSKADARGAYNDDMREIQEASRELDQQQADYYENQRLDGLERRKELEIKAGVYRQPDGKQYLAEQTAKREREIDESMERRPDSD